MIPWYDLGVKIAEDGTPVSAEIVYAHVDHSTGVFRHFAIERIVKLIDHAAIKPDIVEFPIDPIFAAYCTQSRGIERHRLARITPLDLAHYPVVMAHFPGVGKDMEDHLLIDGHHRYVKAAMLGWKTLRAYSLPQTVWEEFLVDIPPELLLHNEDDYRNQYATPIDSRIK